MAFLPLFDHLYCQEESLEMEGGGAEEMAPVVSSREDYETESHVVSVVEASVGVGEDWKEVLSLLADKESEALPLLVAEGDGGDLHLRRAREVEVEWVVLAAARHGFSAVTAVLAVSYFDRCFLPCAGRQPLMRLQSDKPWMGRLAAVACLSLAAKVEETRVPLLLDLQVPPPPAEAASSAEEGGFLFEPKTVRRMELLVLSSLGWKMNPVTALSFIHHLLPRLCSGGGIAARIRELARRSEEALLCVIADWEWVRYPASVWAAAALLRATEPQEAHHLISLLKPSKENLERCYHLMAESMSATNATGHKRKHSSLSSPASPRGVVGSCFSSESSCGSWPLWPPPVSFSPEAAAAAPLKHRKHSKEQF
ncbi:cyclin-D3-2-like [Curcuma longa]|uniref:cyclin-D3-2-like n=1 Tax=Curcuma longa TaxID=136217 RepID=UPI003D9EF38D